MQHIKQAIKHIVGLVGFDIFRKQPEHHYVPLLFGKSSLKLVDPRHDELFREAAYEVVESHRSMLYFDRLYTLYNALCSLKLQFQNNVSIAEVGVYNGGGTRFMATIADALFENCRIYAVDTFEGHSEQDLPDGVEGVRHVAGSFSNTSYEDVCSYLSDFANVSVYKNRIQDWRQDGEFHLVHLDVDIYHPTAYGLEYFGSKMVKGGIIVCDDYGFITCPGVRQAVDEYCETRRDIVKIPMLTGQCVLVFV